MPCLHQFRCLKKTIFFKFQPILKDPTNCFHLIQVQDFKCIKYNILLCGLYMVCENGMIRTLLLFLMLNVNYLGKCGLPGSTVNWTESFSFSVNATVHFSPPFFTSEMWAIVNVSFIIWIRNAAIENGKKWNADVKRKNKNPQGFLFQYECKILFLKINISRKL